MSAAAAQGIRVVMPIVPSPSDSLQNQDERPQAENRMPLVHTRIAAQMYQFLRKIEPAIIRRPARDCNRALCRERSTSPRAGEKGIRYRCRCARLQIPTQSAHPGACTEQRRSRRTARGRSLDVCCPVPNSQRCEKTPA